MAQSNNNDTLCIVEWNVENLFDCKHDSLKNDYEFLPKSIRHWTYYRYRNKLDMIAKGIIAAGGWSAPAIVALCEVENDSVLIALTRYSALKELNYRYVMTNSPDRRGIDVALLYQRNRFKLIKTCSISVAPPKNYHPTRDILHVTGLITLTDTLDIFVVHAPSRSGGMLESQPYRLLCMQVLKKAIEKTIQERKFPHILITGDFNDLPENISISKILQAKIPEQPINGQKIYHLLARYVHQTQTGTYKYKGKWNLLDHFIVSGTLLDSKARIYTNESLAEILYFPFLLTEDTTYGGLRPYRTYYGMKYENGFSDHLPIRLKMIIDNNKD